MDRIIKIKNKAKILAREKGIKTKTALDLLAQENKFSNWKQYKNSIDVFWYNKPASFINHWFVKHIDALSHQEQNGGYILTYKGHYFVVEKEYIEHLGLNPDDPIWNIIHYDVSRSNALNKLTRVFKT